ncbi:uncharacterized protein N7511_000803 [Penicillium nucicola]|uniref:uncharacterized protein n=1 Tax=Penicillium nucicola TaxID=1850975 RepID=UPI00254572D2|nr:uncharacterized protein N7511_000803 [Penicillium nucicola]KAJ5775792.1 hypothetical protein N7511_000803 [Penicillium nucicola]
MHLAALLRLAKRGPESKDRLWEIACRGQRPPFKSAANTITVFEFPIAEFSEAVVRGKGVREQVLVRSFCATASRRGIGERRPANGTHGDGPADRDAGAPAGGEGALLRVRGNQLKQGVRCRVIRKYGIISRKPDRWDGAGERELQHDEREDVERRTELYTHGMGRDAILRLAPRQTASGQAKPEQGTWGPTPNRIEGGAESGRAGTNGLGAIY